MKGEKKMTIVTKKTVEKKNEKVIKKVNKRG